MNSLVEKQPNFLRRMYDWCLQAADTKRAQYIMYGIAFAESSFFPLPPDLMLIPMILANRMLAWRLAFGATVASVVGGLLGYAIGYYLYATIGHWIIETYSLHGSFERFQTDFQAYGFWIIALKGLTPIPFKLVAIAAGATGLNIWQFLLASTISRSIRFFILATCIYVLGDKAKDVINKNLNFVLVGFLVTLVLGFIAFKLIF